ADHVPAVGPPHFDVSLLINTDDRLVRHSFRVQVPRVQLVLGNQSFQRPAGHLDELHRCFLFLVSSEKRNRKSVIVSSRSCDRGSTYAHSWLASAASAATVVV